MARSGIIKNMVNDAARSELLSLLRERSVFRGDFTLASGGKSSYYIDCRLTTFHPRGAWLCGELMHGLIRKAQGAAQIDATGGLTMGADPLALAIGMYSQFVKDKKVLEVFSVRKAPKAHGQTRLIEGNFRKGQTVVVLDDVVTRGESTLKAIDAVEQEGGKIAFVVVLVDRQEGGRQKIQERGYTVYPLFTKDELLGTNARQPAEPKTLGGQRKDLSLMTH
jgi:orotate phosphoribosyltransferase